MKVINKLLHNGINAYQIKVIALIEMTIDHLATYGSEIPIFSDYGSTLRIIGRIAAPLFLFMVTEAMRHTRNRKKYLRRLYIGAVCTSLFSVITNVLFGNTIGSFHHSNILFTFIYTAMLIILVEKVVMGVKEKSLNQTILCAFGIIAVFAVHFVYLLLERYIPVGTFGHDLLNSFLISPIRVEYTILFILMGIAMYFAPNKYWKSAAVIVVSLICCDTRIVYALRFIPFVVTMGPPQHWMILSVPFILLYNGDKGKSQKWFFYTYYPIHRFLICVIEYCYSFFCN